MKNKFTIIIIILILINSILFTPYIEKDNIITYFSMDINKFYLYYSKIILFVSLLFIYLSAKIDFLYKEISDTYTVPVLIIGLLTFNYHNIIYFIAIMSIIRYFTSLIFKREAFGEADIIIYSGISGFFEPSIVLFMWFLSNIIGIFHSYYNKIILKDNDWKIVALIPSIFCSVIITIALNYNNFLSNFLHKFFNF